MKGGGIGAGDDRMGSTEMKTQVSWWLLKLQGDLTMDVLSPLQRPTLLHPVTPHTPRGSVGLPKR